MRAYRATAPRNGVMGKAKLVSAGLTVLVAGMIAAAPGPAVAALQQAPNSRVVLDLPAGYVPSPLFSGFQNEENGVSYVILEMPAKAFGEIASGLNSGELAKRGLTDAEQATLQRPDDYLYMRAQQISPAGAFAKYFVVFKTVEQAVLISVSAPIGAIDAGTVRREDIEKVLAGASTAAAPVARDLYSFGYLGPFREAGRFVGTGKLFTLDGQMEPERKGETRSALVVAPSIDKRPLGNAEVTAKSLLASLSGYGHLKIGTPSRLAIDGREAVELEASAVDLGEGKKVQLYQAIVPGKDGGYFRLIGIATDEEAARLMPEFRKIAGGFRVIQ